MQREEAYGQQTDQQASPLAVVLLCDKDRHQKRHSVAKQEEDQLNAVVELGLLLEQHVDQVASGLLELDLVAVLCNDLLSVLGDVKVGWAPRVYFVTHAELSQLVLEDLVSEVYKEMLDWYLSHIEVCGSVLNKPTDEL